MDWSERVRSGFSDEGCDEALRGGYIESLEGVFEIAIEVGVSGAFV